MAPAGSNPAGDFTSEILQALSQADSISSTETFPDVPFESIKAALDRLASRSMVAYEQVEREEALLEPEAEVIVSHGSHEARVFEAVRQAMNGLSIQDLESKIGDKTVTKVGQGKAFKEKWIKKDGAKLVALVRPSSFFKLYWRSEPLTPLAGRLHQRCDQGAVEGDSGEAHTRSQDHCRPEEAQAAEDAESHLLQDKQGSQVCAGDGEGRDRPDGRDAGIRLLEDGNLQTLQLQCLGRRSARWCFAPPKQGAAGVQVSLGPEAMLPLKSRWSLNYFDRQIFFEMGFTEMPTNQFVESGFWVCAYGFYVEPG
jgi:phenylalanyl-tRNA synthetase alpha chain